MIRYIMILSVNYTVFSPWVDLKNSNKDNVLLFRGSSGYYYDLKLQK